MRINLQLIREKGEKSILTLMTRVRQSFFDNKFFIKQRCHIRFENAFLNA